MTSSVINSEWSDNCLRSCNDDQLIRWLRRRGGLQEEDAYSAIGRTKV